MEHRTDPDDGRSSTADGEEIDAVLRAKYLDYCSARLSEVFLSLSDNQIYELMEEAARDEGLEPGALGSREMVRLVTGKLRESVPLPDLQEWAEEYREDPGRYDPFLLGLWKVPAENGTVAEPWREDV